MKLAPSARKIVGLGKLLRLRGNWSSKRKRVVFTNGVFDLLHPGHVDILERAKRLGDILVVGINTDASARRLGKGPDRPLNALKDRQAVIAGLESVDAVTSFGEDTPEKILSRIRPDVLVKGGDYRINQIAGRQYAKKTLALALKRGYSTTALAKKIRGK